MDVSEMLRRWPDPMSRWGVWLESQLPPLQMTRPWRSQDAYDDFAVGLPVAEKKHEKHTHPLNIVSFGECWMWYLFSGQHLGQKWRSFCIWQLSLVKDVHLCEHDLEPNGKIWQMGKRKDTAAFPGFIAAARRKENLRNKISLFTSPSKGYWHQSEDSSRNQNLQELRNARNNLTIRLFRIFSNPFSQRDLAHGEVCAAVCRGSSRAYGAFSRGRGDRGFAGCFWVGRTDWGGWQWFSELLW